ncbi:MAG: ComF family protein [Sphingobium sp.]
MSFSLPKPLRMLLDYALPSRCSGCGVITGEDLGFCADCWQQLEFLGDPCCRRCGVPFDRDEGDEALCAPCIAWPPSWVSARAALAYCEVSGGIAIRLKYGRRTGLAKLMARHMAARVHPDVVAQRSNAVIIPVPLHRWRLWSRGFNQSALIARHLSDHLAIKADPFILARSKATKPLRNMNPAQRTKAVARAFAINAQHAGRLNGKTVLLIDDIHTSGATAAACARTLLAHGAEAVHLLCWARALPDRTKD